MTLGPLAIVMSLIVAQTEVKPDERIVFFPTFAYQTKDGLWEVLIHGIVFEPETDSRRRAMALSAFRRLLGISREDAQSATFRKRAMRFLVDNEEGKRVEIRFGQTTHPAGVSQSNGHFVSTIQLTNKEFQELAISPEAGGWATYNAIAEGNELFSGRVHFISRRGLSVISDIDDTIKHSQVAQRRALLRNTFLRAFEPVPGMSEVYARWAEQGAVFHYVSGSPWQLYEPLEAFRAAEKFPPGTFHLKLFRVQDASFFELFASQEEHKHKVIELILRAFPERRFVLVGDSGEKDPKIYGALARKFPSQIAHIFIREMNGMLAQTDRYHLAFDELPREVWQVFQEPKEIAAAVRFAQTEEDESALPLEPAR